ncbi:NAD(P)/FAD-dependent oxidoreductase [Mycobacterium sp. DSM 3803]|nr:NAD(P)/FAD-dependent oxidoreductase [Mycobacterium sp. DSM 3803]
MVGTAPQYDAVIIGSGHNGLVAANYLADNGLKVAVLERRSLLGGATVTEEVIPGFRASACSYVAGMLHPKVLRDMNLSQHGLDLYQTEMGSANILRDGRALFMYRDLSRTLRELEKIAPGESDALTAFGLRMERFAALTGQWLLATEPPSVDQVMRAFVDAGDGDLFDEFFTLSVLDLLERYFSSDIVKGLFTFLAMVGVSGGPRTPGWAYVYGHHASGEFNGHMGQFAFPRGGMGSIAEALARRARSKGAVVRTNAAVQKILVKSGRVTGVLLADGEEITAGTVLSNADPRSTFLSLVDGKELPSAYTQHMTRFDDRGSMARVFLALDKLPDFIGCAPGEGPQHRGLTLLGAEVESFERVADAQRYGRYPEDFPIEFIIQSVHDDSLAPAGKHIMSTGIQQLPFELADGTWDDHRVAFTDRVIDVLAGYAPGIRETIIGTHTITPLDLEREYGLPGGNIFHGALTLSQLFESRPARGYGSYRSPIRGLYLCGSGAHPGGGVTGAPGHNSARAVIADRASGGWARSGSSTVTTIRTPLKNRLLANPRIRKVAMAAARQPALAKVVDTMSRR